MSHARPCPDCGQAITYSRKDGMMRAERSGTRCRPCFGRALRVPPAERFWEKVRVRQPDDCWEWMAHTQHGGYGVFWTGAERGIKTTAHRFAFELHTGSPAPDGIHVCHSCDNPPCCNPAHLFLGTPSDNMRDMVKKGRDNPCGPPGERITRRSHCKRGHPLEGDNLFMSRGKRRCRACHALHFRRSYYKAKAEGKKWARGR